MPRDNRKIELFIRYLRGELNDEERELVKRQIANDPVLRNLDSAAAEVRQESEDIEWNKLHNPAHSLLKRVLKDARTAQKHKRGHRGILIFDSQLLPLPEGIRPANMDTRRVRYQVGETTLEMSFYPISPGSYEIIGQLTEVKEADILTVGLRGTKGAFSVKANRHQLFRFPRIPSGNYTLKITAKQKLVAVVDVEL